MNQLNPNKDQNQFENIFGNIPTERLSKNLSENIFLELDSPKPKSLSKKEKRYGLIISIFSLSLISVLLVLFLPNSSEKESSQESTTIVIGIILLIFLIALFFFLRQLKRTNSNIKKIKAK